MTEIVEWLLTPYGQNAVAAASRARAVSPDPLAVAACLTRELDLPGPYRAAATLQAELRERLLARWGESPAWLLTRDGIEQATHPIVRRWRAERLAGLGVKSIADLGCGLGFESASFAAAGMSVRAVERDPETAAVAYLNLRETGVAVAEFDVVADPAELDAVLSDVDAVFVDPARRDPNAPRDISGSGSRQLNPEKWSPTWSWVLELGQRQPRLVAKVAPGIDKQLLPAGSQTTWFAVRGTLLEASVWWPGFGLPPGCRAVAVDRHGDMAEIDDHSPISEEIGNVGAFLLDPSPAVTRSGLVTNLAHLVNARRIDELTGYLTTDQEPADSPLFTTYEVVQVLDFDERALPPALQAAGARDVQITSRGWRGDVNALTSRLKSGLTGDKVISLLIARVGDEHIAVLAQRLN